MFLFHGAPHRVEHLFIKHCVDPGIACVMCLFPRHLRHYCCYSIIALLYHHSVIGKAFALRWRSPAAFLLLQTCRNSPIASPSSIIAHGRRRKPPAISSSGISILRSFPPAATISTVIVAKSVFRFSHRLLASLHSVPEFATVVAFHTAPIGGLGTLASSVAELDVEC